MPAASASVPSVSVPSVSVPPAGGADAGGVGAVLDDGRDVTTSDAALVTVVEPPTLPAVTDTRSVLPTSSPVSSYREPVAPPTAEQSAPAALQRRHWYAYPSGRFDQLPVDARSVLPARSSPSISGNAVLVGAGTATGMAATTPEGALDTEAEPPMRRRHDDAQRVTDVVGIEGVVRRRRTTDPVAGRATGVAAPPLVVIRARAGPGARRGDERLPGARLTAQLRRRQRSRRRPFPRRGRPERRPTDRSSPTPTRLRSTRSRRRGAACAPRPPWSRRRRSRPAPGTAAHALPSNAQRRHW